MKFGRRIIIRRDILLRVEGISMLLLFLEQGLSHCDYVEQKSNRNNCKYREKKLVR